MRNTGEQRRATNIFVLLGVNMRHLGVMWYNFSDPSWERVALTDAACRVAKHTVQSMMRTSMREIQLASDEPYLRVVVGFINFLFGDTPESTRYWNTEFRWSLEKNFFYIDDSLKKELKRIKNIKERVDLLVMFERLLERLNARVAPELLERAAVPSFFQQEMIVAEKDFISISPVITSGLTDHPKAFLLYQQVGPSIIPLYFRFLSPSSSLTTALFQTGILPATGG